MIIECTYGPVSTEVMGTTYNFTLDEHGRYVAEVWIPKHIQSFLNVIDHYKRVDKDPNNPSPDDTPVLDSLDPDTAVIGSEDITLRCIGSNFAVDSVIVFNGGDEPTSFVTENEVTTVVRPATASLAGDYAVYVRTGSAQSESVDFAFTDPVVRGAKEEETADEEDDVQLSEEDLEEPREDKPRVDVTAINGIGPAMAGKLADVGITEIRQIAELSDDDAASLDEELGLGGRIARDKWVEQAKALDV